MNISIMTAVHNRLKFTCVLLHLYLQTFCYFLEKIFILTKAFLSEVFAIFAFKT